MVVRSFIALPISSCALRLIVVSNIRAQCRQLGDAPQGYREKTRGRRGIRGNSAKKNKSKTTRIFRRARLFLEHATTSWVERTSVPRVFSRSSWPGESTRDPSLHRLQAATQPPHDAPFAHEDVVRAAGRSRIHHFAADAARHDRSRAAADRESAAAFRSRARRSPAAARTPLRDPLRVSSSSVCGRQSSTSRSALIRQLRCSTASPTRTSPGAYERTSSAPAGSVVGQFHSTYDSANDERPSR